MWRSRARKDKAHAVCILIYWCAWRYTAESGRAWRYMVGVACILVYRLHGGGWERYTVGAGQHSRKEARYTNATMGIFVYDMQTQYTTAITRASQRPGACIACACVRALYYYIIILL